VCDNIRLRTYLILLAATGMRAVEALSIRIKDIDFDSNPANLFVRGKYTKTKVDRIIFLTEEITQQLKSWLEYKHRTRRVCHQDTRTGKTITEFRTPDKKDTDLIFSVYQDKKHLIPILYMMIWLDLSQRHLIVQVKVIGRMVIKGVDR